MHTEPQRKQNLKCILTYTLASIDFQDGSIPDFAFGYIDGLARIQILFGFITFLHDEASRFEEKLRGVWG